MDVACGRECLTPTVRLGWQKSRESHKALSNVELTVPRDRRKRRKTSQRREKKINGKYWVTEKLLRNDASYQNKQQNSNATIAHLLTLEGSCSCI